MTHPADLPAGFELVAGLGRATVLPDIDFETYSEAGCVFVPDGEGGGKWAGPPGAGAKGKGLPIVGAAVYATHPSTEALSLSYNLKEGRGSRRWMPDLPRPYDLFDYVQRGGLLEAWNSAFEWWIWNYVCVRRYGWPALPLEQMRCAMAKARAHGYPGKLEVAGRVMGLTTPKDESGTALLRKLSGPRNTTKTDKRLRWTPESAPEDFAALYRYNDRDILAEAEASAKCPDLTGEELDFWLADQRINRRGVAVDVESLHACAHLVRICLERYDSELHQLTGGAVERASQLERLKGWLAGHGVYAASMDEEAVGELLKDPGLSAGARRALEIRQAVGSASVKKVFAMINQLSPWGRLHDLFNYHAARTGRPTGDGPQPTNLPKAGPKVRKCFACGHHSGAHLGACAWCGAEFLPGHPGEEWGPDAMEDVLAVIKTGDLARVEHVFGDAMLCVSGCLRGLFIGGPGKELIASDFSSIEGVVTACIAGEDWRVEMFATHGKAYELSVSKITGTPFAEIMAHAGFDDVESPGWWTRRARKGSHHPLRQTLGKVAELASGFGGWINAWKRFGADAFMGDEEIKKAILGWRAASPAIVELWGGQERRIGWDRVPELYGLEGAAVAAVLAPGEWRHVMRLDGTHSGVSYLCHEDALYCWLPSQRALVYHRPRLDPNTRGFGGKWSLSFEGYNTNPQQGQIGWVRMDTYGGKLCENVVQATARDIQRHAIVNLERAGYPVVLHVYDEDVVEVPEGHGSIEEVELIMGTMPPWAAYKGKPWPIRAAGGWRGKRYRKE